jgi:hypothetical protein
MIAMGANDTMSALFVALSQSQSLDLQNGRDEVTGDETRAEDELKKEQQALQAEQANEAGSGRGLFSGLGHLVGDMGKDLCTCNFSGAVGDAGHDLGDIWNSPKFWNQLTKGLEAVAAVAADVALVAQGVPGVGTSVAAVARGVSIATCVAAGATNVRVTGFEAGETNARADATQAQGDIDAIHVATSDTLDDLSVSTAAYGNALNALCGAIETSDRTALLTTSNPLRG